MNMERQVLRTGAAMIACALALRLLSGGLMGGLIRTLTTPEAASWILFLGTGRRFHYAEPVPTVPTLPAESPALPQPATRPPEPTEPEQVLPAITFTGEEAARIHIKNYCDYTLDVAQLLRQPLDWQLRGAKPTVLILHSHGSESYENTEGYQSAGSYRTLDEAYNMVSIGDRVAQLLEAEGIGVVHDRTLHDQPSYNGSYAHARASLESLLEENPSVQLILDLHRDAAQDSAGNQIGYTVSTPRGEAAKLMLVLGTEAGGQSHPAWRENLALGVKLQALLEESCPGICRTMQLRTSRFNQDLRPGAVLVEVGAAGNTRQEALLAAEILANAVLELAEGANCG